MTKNLSLLGFLEGTLTLISMFSGLISLIVIGVISTSNNDISSTPFADWAPLIGTIGIGLVAFFFARITKKKILDITAENRSKFFANALDRDEFPISIENKSESSTYPENQQYLERMSQIVSYVGLLMETDGTDFRDESELAYPKNEIRKVLLTRMIAEEKEEMASALANGALHLANYQKDVGSQPLNPFGIPYDQMPQTSDSEGILALTETMTNNPLVEKYHAISPLVSKELDDIYAEVLKYQMIRKEYMKRKNE